MVQETLKKGIYESAGFGRDVKFRQVGILKVEEGGVQGDGPNRRGKSIVNPLKE